jgi:WD40 repeat protein
MRCLALKRCLSINKEVTCVLSLKSGMIVTGCLDTNIRIWDPKTEKCIRVLDGHTHAVLCIIELETGYLASGSLDQTAIVWDPNKGKIVNMLEGFQNPIIGMFELNSKQLVINFNEPIFLIWSWSANPKEKDKSNSTYFSVGDSNLTCIIKQDNENVICGCEDGQIHRIKHTQQSTPIMTYKTHSDVIIGIEMVGKKKFVSNSTDMKLVLWEIDTGKALKVMEVAGDMIMQMFYHQELDLLIFSSLDGKVRAVDLTEDDEEVNVKYVIDQGSPIFFSLVVGYKEMKFLSKKIDDDDSPKQIADQVIVEESKIEDSPIKDSPSDNEKEDSKSKNVNDSKQSVSRSKIIKNHGIDKRMSGYKQKVKIQGLFDINKHVLDDAEAEEMMSKGMCFVVATINQDNGNSIILWDLMAPTKKG